VNSQDHSYYYDLVSQSTNQLLIVFFLLKCFPLFFILLEVLTCLHHLFLLHHIMQPHLEVT